MACSGSGDEGHALSSVTASTRAEVDDLSRRGLRRRLASACAEDPGIASWGDRDRWRMTVMIVSISFFFWSCSAEYNGVLGRLALRYPTILSMA